MMEIDHTNDYDVIVIGAGPAGLTAGIYLSRSRARTLILNDGVAGGQMILTHEVANYPGVETISGYQLSGIMKKQALSFGCTIRTNVSISNVKLDGESKQVILADGTVCSAKAVILATGGRPRNIGAPGEAYFRGKGISYCATCDGDFFTDKEIVVVGGGNSALEEAVSLTKYASKVTVVHQLDHFQAYEHAIDEARQNPKVNFILESVIASFNGADSIHSVDIMNLRTKETHAFKTDGVFVFIGYLPNTEFLEGKVNLNSRKEIVVTEELSTNIPGVFAAGDCIAKKVRQVTTAVGDGTVAALSALNYLNNSITGPGMN